MSKKIGLRQAVKLAENHTLGLLDSTYDGAFWGEDFFFDQEDESDWAVFNRAKEIILNRIRKTK